MLTKVGFPLTECRRKFSLGIVIEFMKVVHLAGPRKHNPCSGPRSTTPAESQGAPCRGLWRKTLVGAREGKRGMLSDTWMCRRVIILIMLTCVSESLWNKWKASTRGRINYD